MELALPLLGLHAVVRPSHATGGPTAATFYAYDVHSSSHSRAREWLEECTSYA